MTAPLISVIMPAYNHERFVGQAVASVLGQSLEDLELIVIDDGSSDGTGQVVQGFDDPRLRYLYQPNQDAYNALNRGLRLVRGRFIAILNSDDLYTPQRLQRLVEAQAQSGAECLFSDVSPIDAEGRAIDDPAHGWNVWHRRNREFYQRSRDLYIGFLNGNFMVTTSNLFLTHDAAAAVGRFAPLRYLHDYDYIFRILQRFPQQVHYLEHETLLRYRIHGGNTLSQAAIVGREQDCELIRHYMLARLPQTVHGLFNRALDSMLWAERGLCRLRRHEPRLAVRIARRVARAPLRAWQAGVRRMMRQRISRPLQAVLQTGTERLLTLQRELFEVRQALAG